MTDHTEEVIFTKLYIPAPISTTVLKETVYSRVISAAVQGIDAYIVKVEVSLDSALPSYVTVGLPDSAVKESRERVHAAIKNSGFIFPQKKITVNLAPASIRKEGASFDLPIALGILAATGQISEKNLTNLVCVGELALDGNIRPIRGALSISSTLDKKRLKTMLVPKVNAPEAAMVESVDVIPVKTLRETVEFINGNTTIEPLVVDVDKLFADSITHLVDLHDVRGQENVKRALEIAAAGGHNMLMIGPPGSGKTMLAKRLPTILPNLTLDEALETTKIYSIAGVLPPETAILSVRPFRNPHHTVSDAGLIGGGQVPRPGEVSLSHKGILFLDELPEFRKNVLEVLRQPLEAGEVTITRSKMSLTYPSNFILVAAMNPCPCGYYGHPVRECRCSGTQVQKYLGHVSGPLIDRIDIQVEVPSVEYKELSSDASGEYSADIRQRILNARQIQSDRFKHVVNLSVNADMGSRETRKYCKLDSEGSDLLKTALNTMGLSARAYDKILKVARTIADLDHKTNINPGHIAEAIQYRNLDKEYWI